MKNIIASFILLLLVGCATNQRPAEVVNTPKSSKAIPSKSAYYQVKKGDTLVSIAKRFGVALTSVMRWSNNIESIKKRNKPATKIDMEALKRDVEQYPDAYQFERAERLSVSEGCVFHALKRLGVTYKKNSAASQGNSRKTLCFLRQAGGI